ncbi:hypothetical protein PPERSA_02741 [Pseudocohnilembus persalinus]|uniref:Cyclin-like protein n=1 Tax=Pseudocohnilembus persalinus TaxID=266149 RepID=A0A0V0R745_PSEPJ|nr:hypothetical protein PPERSA_02741 [Pseudocohnilembus persalinus]|eukprot:KRX10324.1 hypothetical protein PPERSA_02741 [Pseudocohnilembus persalinus]
MLKQQNKKQLKNKSTQLESPNNFPACEKSKQISNSLFSTDDSANDDDSSNDNCSLNDSISSIKQLSPLSQVSPHNSNVFELEEELLEKFYNNNKIEQNLKYLNEDHYVIALYWIDQYVNKTGTEINSQNIDRLLIVSLMLTDKFYNDNCYQNIFVPYSKISQLKIQELKKLELIFIEQLNYNLYLILFQQKSSKNKINDIYNVQFYIYI